MVITVQSSAQSVLGGSGQSKKVFLCPLPPIRVDPRNREFVMPARPHAAVVDVIELG